MRRLGITTAAGVAIGALSRIEEVADGFDAGISSNSLWVALAFAAGIASRSVAGGAGAGTLALSAANAGYYAWVALTEPERPLDSVAGPVLPWVLLGVAAGVVFGGAGRLWRAGPAGRRWAASLVPAAFAVGEVTGWNQWLLP
jgi:hypothetical protein